MQREATVRLVDFCDLRALVHVKLDLMEIRGFKILDHGNGKPEVSVPIREVFRDGQREQYNIIRFPTSDAGNAAKKEFFDWILSCYRAELEKEK